MVEAEGVPGQAVTPAAVASTADVAAAEPEEPGLKELEQSLESAVETLGGVASLLSKYSHDVQDTLYGRVNEFVGDLALIDEAGSKVDSSIPRDILGAIDRGRNPQQMTYRSLEEVAQVSVSARAKLSAMKEFRTALQEEIGAEMLSQQASESNSNPPGRPSGAGHPESSTANGLGIQRP